MPKIVYATMRVFCRDKIHWLHVTTANRNGTFSKREFS